MTLKHIIIGICVSSLLGGTAEGQWINYPSPGTPRLTDGKANLSAPTPRTADGKPDLSGIWRRVRYSRAGRGDGISDLENYLPAGASIPLLQWAEDLTRQRLAMAGAELPSGRCLPKSFPNQMIIENPIQIVQGPAFTLVLFEEFNHFRQIMTDGRTHPPDMNPTWFGYSVGRWDGDTMVVDTVGFRDQMWLDGTGHPSTERFSGDMRGEISGTWRWNLRSTTPVRIRSRGWSGFRSNCFPTRACWSTSARTTNLCRRTPGDDSARRPNKRTAYERGAPDRRVD